MTLHPVVVPSRDDPSSSHAKPDAGLARAECSALAAAIRRLPGEWVTREHEDRSTHPARTIVLLLPRDEHDEQVPLFLVWRTRGTLHLCKGQGTEATDLGRFADIAAVMASVGREVRDYLAVDRQQPVVTGASLHPSPQGVHRVLQVRTAVLDGRRGQHAAQLAA